MNHDELTIKTYDDSADALAEYFSGIGPRVKYLELVFRLSGQDPADMRVVEIGCGDGRDAAAIVQRVGWYEGFDPSEQLLQIARRKVPHAKFILATAQNYSYPSNIDAYIAFASMLHLGRQDFAVVCCKVAASLRPGGIFYLSLKERPQYQEEMLEDRFGQRMFYYYDSRLVKELTSEWFEVASEDHETFGKTQWLELALRRL